MSETKIVILPIREPVNKRRIARVAVSYELLGLVLSGQAGLSAGYRIQTDAPGDLNIIGIEASGVGVAHLFCTSERFDPVPDNEVPPLIEPFRYEIVKIEREPLAV